MERPVDIAHDHYLLRITCPRSFECHAGQFVNIRTTEGNDPLLRRPFSIFNYQDSKIELVIQKKGRGTALIEKIRGRIDMLSPLGRGFTIPGKGKALLVGGGVGNAPLYLLAKELKAAGVEVTYCYGARNDASTWLPHLYKDIANDFHISTDDGSLGTKGYVTDLALSLAEKEKFDYCYTCGPTPMMRILAEKLPSDIQLEVSLENYFGCGVGLCSGCTVETSQGLQRACVDGPVFNGHDINWDSIPD